MNTLRRLRNLWIPWVATIALGGFSEAVAQVRYQVPLDGRLMKGRSFESAVASPKPGSRSVITFMHEGGSREATLIVGTKSIGE
jgi:hypothetical protein